MTNALVAKIKNKTDEEDEYRLFYGNILAASKIKLLLLPKDESYYNLLSTFKSNYAHNVMLANLVDNLTSIVDKETEKYPALEAQPQANVLMPPI
ncbi:hypothetical protein [Spiroplasma endosymbiont of Nebria brevicollis]|uniref:hypothetical protein n=1 Tax=Spiroplasma endosymbiont of Nebria brevicollis TaxID=3066284 RepID=UPI00313BE574